MNECVCVRGGGKERKKEREREREIVCVYSIHIRAFPTPSYCRPNSRGVDAGISDSLDRRGKTERSPGIRFSRQFPGILLSIPQNVGGLVISRQGLF